MKQYENNSNHVPKIVANIVDKNDARKNSRISSLEQQIEDQAATIRRMGKDIVRIREIINQVAARIK